MTTVVCPVCGDELTVEPGYFQNGLAYEFARCGNKRCPVQTIRVEWRPS